MKIWKRNLKPPRKSSELKEEIETSQKELSAAEMKKKILEEEQEGLFEELKSAFTGRHKAQLLQRELEKELEELKHQVNLQKSLQQDNDLKKELETSQKELSAAERKNELLQEEQGGLVKELETAVTVQVSLQKSLQQENL